MRLAESEIAVLDYLIAGEQRAELRVANLVDVAGCVSYEAKSHVVVIREAVIYPQKLIIGICGLNRREVSQSGLNRHSVDQCVRHASEHWISRQDAPKKRNRIQHGRATGRRLAGPQWHCAQRRKPSRSRNSHRALGISPGSSPVPLEQEEEEGPITSVLSDALAAFAKARQLDASADIKTK